MTTVGKEMVTITFGIDGALEGAAEEGGAVPRITEPEIQVLRNRSHWNVGPGEGGLQIWNGIG